MKLNYNNKEASQALGVSVRTLYNLRKSGLLKSYKFNGRNYYRKEDLDEAIKKLSEDSVLIPSQRITH